MNRQKKIGLAIAISIVTIVLVLAEVVAFTKQRNIRTRNTLDTDDYGILYVLGQELLKPIEDNDSHFEKMYFDGIRLFMLIDKTAAKDYNLENICIKSAGKQFYVDQIMDIDSKNRLFVWDYVETNFGAVILEYNGPQGKQDVTLPRERIRANSPEVNKKYKELYVTQCKYGETSFYMKFRLDAAVSPSDFQVIYNEDVEDGYTLSQKGKEYEVVFPLKVDPGDDFEFIINDENGNVYSHIPIKY